MTASSGWRADELSAIDGCGEAGIATRRSDGTLRPARVVWIVRHGDAVYVRSVNGTAAWYRGVQTCYEGELSAKSLQRGVVFVEPVSTLARAAGWTMPWMPPIAASTAARPVPSPASPQMSPA
ncbi:MAG: hypothetical protein QOH87_4432 [Trebonia sp.]|nr:hypothetical protein [Trebonia sp.]